jgi:hypothetical protein
MHVRSQEDDLQSKMATSRWRHIIAKMEFPNNVSNMSIGLQLDSVYVEGKVSDLKHL